MAGRGVPDPPFGASMNASLLGKGGVNPGNPTFEGSSFESGKHFLRDDLNDAHLFLRTVLVGT